MALFNRIIARVSGSIVANASVNGLRNGAGWMGTDGPTPPVCAYGQPSATYLSERNPSQYPTLDTKPTEDVTDTRLDERCLDERVLAEHSSVRAGQLGCSSGVSNGRVASLWRLADMPSPALLASRVARSLDSFGNSKFRRASFTRLCARAFATCCQAVMQMATQAIQAGCPLAELGQQAQALAKQAGKWCSKHFQPSSALSNLAMGMGGIGGRIPPAGAEVSGRYAAGGA